MRAVALAVVAVALIVAASAEAIPAVATNKPVLHLMPGTTLAVRGTGFKPSERVRLSARTREGARLRTVTANQRGAFVARWALPADYCTGVFLVRATDSSGRTVSLRVAPWARECALLAP